MISGGVSPIGTAGLQRDLLAPPLLPDRCCSTGEVGAPYPEFLVAPEPPLEPPPAGMTRPAPLIAEGYPALAFRGPGALALGQGRAGAAARR